MQKEISLYIHIPFCYKKCPYCHFISYDNKNSLIPDYINALSKEIQFYKNKYPSITLKTIYIGGGTPSILSLEELRSLFNTINKYFPVQNNIEFTLEVNPKSLDLNKLKFLKSAGVNRLSIGAQTFNNQELNYLGRVHSSKDIIKCFSLSRKAGFNNINLDLIFAIPNQTIDDFSISLSSAINLEPEHISLYNLTIEEGAIWHKNNVIKLPDNDTDFKMYQKAINFLKNNKYLQYEISNFSKYGRHSRHNLTYWNNKEYIGIGVGAHSFLDNKRYNQIEDLLKYIDNPVPEDTLNKTKSLSKKNNIQESMFLNLRLLDGIDINDFQKQYHYTPDYFFKEQLKELKELNLIKEHKNHLKLTRRGLYLANEVFEKFV